MPAYVPQTYIPKALEKFKAADILVADPSDVFTATEVESALLELYNAIQEKKPQYSFVLRCSDEVTPLAVSSGVFTFRFAHYFKNIQAIRATLTTAQVSGAIFTVDIKRNGASIFSLPLTIDNGEKTSKTATPYVGYSDYFLDDDEITIDITQIGDGTAKGLKIYFVGIEEQEVLGNDPLYGDVVLLMHFEGVAGSTTLLDSSHLPATFAGAGAYQLTNVRKHGASSILSSEAYLAPAPGYFYADQETAFNFGTDDFCIECDYIRTISGINGFIWSTVNVLGAPGSSSQLGMGLFHDSGSNYVQLRLYSGTTAYSSPSTYIVLSLNTWYRIRVSRQGATFRIYINDVIYVTWTPVVININPSRYLFCFRRDSADTFVNYCRIDELRVTRRHSREPYVATSLPHPNQATDPNFDSVSLLLPFHGASAGTTFTDKSKHSRAMTLVAGVTTSRLQRVYGLSSGLFNGSGWLTTPAHADFAFGSGDYDISLWFRTTLASTWQYLVSTGEYNTNQMSIRVSDTNLIQAYHANGGGAYGVKSGPTVTLNDWHFVQLKRTSGITEFWYDEVLVNSVNTVYTTSSSGVVSVGNRTGPVTSFPLTGNIQDLRIAKGVTYATTKPIAPRPTALATV